MIMIYPSEITKKWPHRPLSEVVDFLDSKRKPITQKDRVPGPYPYYGANGQQDSVADYIFDEPLVLLAEDGGHFGDADKTIAYQVEGKCWVNNHAHVLRPKKDVDIRYICRHLERYDVTPFITGSTRGKLTKTAANNIPIALPPLEEQRRIAAILDKADGVRRKRKEAIRLTEELLRSTFLEMFGDPVTNPKGWRKISLGELLAEPLQNGAYFPKERYVEAPDGVEMVHMSDAFYNFVERGQLKRVQVTSEEFEKYKLIPNDVLIARRSLNYEGSAKPCLISEADQPLIFESSLIRVRLNAEVIDSFFFFSYMLEPRARSAYVFPNVTKSTISGINQAGLRRISVLVPPMSNQKKYRDIYKKILGTQSNYQKDYENIDNLFNSLLQRAFRGEL
jgi:type I restriction enzyme S subunit